VCTDSQRRCTRNRLPDPRQSWRVAFPLLLLLTCATIADCVDFDEIVAGAATAWILYDGSLHFILGSRVPADVVNRLDPLLFGSWIKELWSGRHDLVAIGGRTSCRTHDKGKGLTALHTLGAPNVRFQTIDV
jgi:hypothetical protein